MQISYYFTRINIVYLVQEFSHFGSPQQIIIKKCHCFGSYVRKPTWKLGIKASMYA